MGIISISDDLAINSSEFKSLEIIAIKQGEIRSTGEKLYTYELILNYSGEEKCIYWSKDKVICRLAYYWYLYLIGSSRDNLVEFDRGDKYWFDTLVKDFIDALEIATKEGKNIKLDLLEEYRIEIKDHIRNKFS